jgi:hypothetical protein
MTALSRPMTEKASLLEMVCDEVGSTAICPNVKETSSTLLLKELFSSDSSSFQRRLYLDCGLPSFFFFQSIDFSIHDGIILGKAEQNCLERKR